MQRQELAEMDRVQRRFLAAEEALHNQTEALEGMKIQVGWPV